MNEMQDRLTIEGRLTWLETTVKEIRDNHLAHIEAKINWLIVLIITTLLGMVVTFLTK